MEIHFNCDGEMDEGYIHGLLMGSLVIVRDGSYMPHLAKDVCSAGFLCSIARRQGIGPAKGSVVERSDCVQMSIGLIYSEA